MKVGIITGASGGIGRNLTLALVKEGFYIIMGCKDKQKGNLVCEQIKQQTNNTNIEVIEIDLSSIESINQFVKEVYSKYNQIDVLLNNAGVLCKEFQKTKENVEYTIAVNYLGSYILTEQLFPLMVAGTKVINTVSLMLRYGKIHSDFLSAHSFHFERFANYSHSKLALYYATLEWSKKWKDKGITVNCVDPGIVNTNIIRLGNKVIDKLCDVFFRPLIRTPQQGADSIIYLAIENKNNDITGKLFKSRKIKQISSSINEHSQKESLKNQTNDFIAKYIR
jgi:NAD(P)-dependent dehydrogenase (short-subunit alcohol dehydrogenase family)